MNNSKIKDIHHSGPSTTTKASDPTMREQWKPLPKWPCLPPSTAVAVTPLRNLTGDPEQQSLVDGLTDHLLTDLFRRCRSVLFAWLSAERRWAANLGPPNPPELKYVVFGSVQQGSSHGMLKANLRISDAATATTFGRAGTNSGLKIWPRSRPRWRGKSPECFISWFCTK